MPLAGIEKDRYTYANDRIIEQKEFWPDYVKKLDEESHGHRFRSEAMSYTDLWNLYIAGSPDELTPEEESRGKKKKVVERISAVIPARAFELPGRYSIRGKNHNGPWGYLHFDQWLYARDQCRKELYFLCKEVLDLDLQPHVHQVVCDQFVTKNFDDIYKDGYSLRQFQTALAGQSRVPQIWMQTAEYEKKTLGDFGHYIPDPIEAEKPANQARTMVLLDSRGFFKSSIDMVDTIQWLINCPDIRILLLSGVNKLAAQFMRGVKQGVKRLSFYLPKGIRPEPFHLLFPEYVIRGVDGSSESPLIISERVRKHSSLDPSFGIISVGSSLSGFHCDILKFDDIVTDDNCLSEDARQAILLKADGATNLLMGWGWHDVIGTRYYPDDYYGLTKKTYDDNSEMFNLKFFQRACWTVKEEYKDVESKSLYDLKEHMVNLTFPELNPKGPHASFMDLRAKLKNERSFRCFPAGCLVLMSDWTEKSIEQIKPGDEVVGFTKGLEKAAVTAIHQKRGEVIRAVTNTGRVILTTPDHEFLRPINRKRRDYGHLEVGSGVVSVYVPSVTPSFREQRILDWLGGLLDGEGSCASQISLYQSEKENPEVFQAIRTSLTSLNFLFSENLDLRNGVTQFQIGGGRSAKIRILQHCEIYKKSRFVKALWRSAKMIAESSGRGGGSSYEKIISIESLGEQNVYDLTTSTSNYVCQGFSVHNCQQLNQPVWGDETSVSFDRLLLETHRNKPFAEVMAATGSVFGAIDLARENKQFSDFTAIAAGKVYQEGLIHTFLSPTEMLNWTPPEVSDAKWIMVVLDIEFGKWSQTEISNRISRMHDKWRPKSWYGEDIGGIQLLKEKIADVSKTTYGHWPYIRWEPPENSDNAKRNRIKGLELLLRGNRLYFLTASWNQEVFDQLEKYKGQKSSRYFKDDVPDVLSLLTKFVPSLVTLSKKDIEQQASQKEAEYREILRREIQKQIYGTDAGGFGVPSQENYYHTFGVEPPAPSSPYNDITKKIFGGNGMRAG